MKIVLLGATGQTGQPLVRQALASGHTVTAVVRSPGKLDSLKKELSGEESDRFHLVGGNIFSADDLAGHFQGADAAVSTLGFSITDRSTTGYSDATKAVAEAMSRTTTCKRLVLMHAWNTKPESRAECSFFVRHTMIPLLRPLLDDMDRAESRLRGVGEGEVGSDVEWTIVCPPGLKNGSVTGGQFKTAAEKYQVDDPSSSRIARADVARFILRRALEDGDFKRQVVSISL